MTMMKCISILKDFSAQSGKVKRGKQHGLPRSEGQGEAGELEREMKGGRERASERESERQNVYLLRLREK